MVDFDAFQTLLFFVFGSIIFWIAIYINGSMLYILYRLIKEWWDGR